MVYTDLEHPETVMESYAYSYDKNSNIVEKTQVNNYPQKDEEKVNETKHYTYDSLGRLVKAVTTDHRKDDSKQTVTYTYDKVGNRLAEDKGDTKTTYDYNGLDQVKTSTTWKDGTVQENKQYVYDKNGNEIGQTNGTTGEILYRTYDAENRLTEVSVNKDGKNAVVQQNRYNGDGQRIQRVEGDQTTNYYYQDDVVSYTTDGKGEQTSQDLLGTDGNVIGTQRYTGNDAAYYVYNKDVQGSTTNLVRDNGKADVSYRYEDFGETTSVGENTSGNETCYTGGRYDETTGLYYLNARYYNPEDGRFLSEDTYRGEVNQPDSHHLYTYCANDPVNFIDPSGFMKSTYVLAYYNRQKPSSKLTEQAWHSPYYRTENVSIRSVPDFSALKSAWNGIKSNVRKVFLFFHGRRGTLEFLNKTIHSNQITSGKGFKVKKKLKKVYLIICHGAVGDKKVKSDNISVAKRFYDLTGKKANIYASKYYVNFKYIHRKGRAGKVYYPIYGGVDKLRDPFGRKNPVVLTYKGKK